MPHTLVKKSHRDIRESLVSHGKPLPSIFCTPGTTQGAVDHFMLTSLLVDNMRI